MRGSAWFSRLSFLGPPPTKKEEGPKNTGGGGGGLLVFLLVPLSAPEAQRRYPSKKRRSFDTSAWVARGPAAIRTCRWISRAWAREFLGPSARFSPFFFGEGRVRHPSKIDYRNKKKNERRGKTGHPYSSLSTGGPGSIERMRLQEDGISFPFVGCILKGIDFTTRHLFIVGP